MAAGIGGRQWRQAVAAGQWLADEVANSAAASTVCVCVCGCVGVCVCVCVCDGVVGWSGGLERWVEVVGCSCG